MTTKLAIAIDLNQLRALMREFIDTRKEYGEQSETELTFEVFLQWLARTRQETTNEHPTDYPGVEATRIANR